MGSPQVPGGLTLPNTQKGGLSMGRPLVERCFVSGAALWVIPIDQSDRRHCLLRAEE